ncbi:MAG: hypothetical protein ACRERE_45765 [Candidatus Entotheonellia bacterium]
MATAHVPVSDMLVTVKSRELQRGMLAEMRGDRSGAVRHFLAAAHLELVLADDYEQFGQLDLALRSRLSAASCFWRAGQPDHASEIFDAMVQEHPTQEQAIREVIAVLEHDYPKAGPSV